MGKLLIYGLESRGVACPTYQRVAGLYFARAMKEGSKATKQRIKEIRQANFGALSITIEKENGGEISAEWLLPLAASQRGTYLICPDGLIYSVDSRHNIQIATESEEIADGRRFPLLSLGERIRDIHPIFPKDIPSYMVRATFRAYETTTPISQVA